LTRTAKGEALLREAVAERALEIEPLPIREIDRMQPGQLKRRKQLKLRAAVYHLLGRKTPTYNRKALNAYQAGLGAKEKLSIFLGTLRRMLRLLARQKRSNSA
jgi:coenzyme F420 hydrogenase subunit beta